MNEYKVTNIIGVESGPIIAVNEDDARRVYRNCHKGPDARIKSVELISENVPATKQQEWEALEKIKQMVAELGPASYLATAFAGCFEIADQNIEYDAADSLKGRLELAEKRESAALEKLAAAQSDVELLTSQLNHANELGQKIQEYKDTLTKMNGLLTEACSSAGDAQRRAEEAEAQVIRLEAKLYDYMTAAA